MGKKPPMYGYGYGILTKLGWSQGKGIGKNEHGISEYIKPRRKSNYYGLGFDLASDLFGNYWWGKQPKKAGKNQTDSNHISDRVKNLPNMDPVFKNLYGNFVKGGLLPSTVKKNEEIEENHDNDLIKKSDKKRKRKKYESDSSFEENPKTKKLKVTENDMEGTKPRKTKKAKPDIEEIEEAVNEPKKQKKSKKSKLSKDAIMDTIGNFIEKLKKPKKSKKSDIIPVEETQQTDPSSEILMNQHDSDPSVPKQHKKSKESIEDIPDIVLQDSVTKTKKKKKSKDKSKSVEEPEHPIIKTLEDNVISDINIATDIIKNGIDVLSAKSPTKKAKKKKKKNGNEPDASVKSPFNGLEKALEIANIMASQILLENETV